MDDNLAFIRTILENPDDPAPRLVYADWLEERGEHLRLEAKLATGSLTRGQRRRVRRRLRELRAHRPELAGDARPDGGGELRIAVRVSVPEAVGEAGTDRRPLRPVLR
ncbi:MAG TPA: TIGR02996 domain-containing protein, partial [Gemmataceae bacterium]